MDDLIIPNFRRGDFSTGILDGVRGLEAMARGLELPKPTQPWWILPLFILGIIGIGILIYNLFKTGKSGWAWALIAFLGIEIGGRRREQGV
ncbi:MAG: TPM domain-containing protein [Planctomycetes bacterium]|nr:TPM domain-containing protein [Planctomycetota bacterium]